MSIKCGIVGLPNVGKSTLFNALTASDIPAENYPFCTIKPNREVVNVTDQRVKRLAELAHLWSNIHHTVEFFDIAGRKGYQNATPV